MPLLLLIALILLAGACTCTAKVLPVGIAGINFVGTPDVAGHYTCYRNARPLSDYAFVGAGRCDLIKMRARKGDVDIQFRIGVVDPNLLPGVLDCLLRAAGATSRTVDFTVANTTMDALHSSWLFSAGTPAYICTQETINLANGVEKLPSRHPNLQAGPARKISSLLQFTDDALTVYDIMQQTGTISFLADELACGDDGRDFECDCSGFALNLSDYQAANSLQCSFIYFYKFDAELDDRPLILANDFTDLEVCFPNFRRGIREVSLSAEQRSFNDVIMRSSVDGRFRCACMDVTTVQFNQRSWSSCQPWWVWFLVAIGGYAVGVAMVGIISKLCKQ